MNVLSLPAFYASI